MRRVGYLFQNYALFPNMSVAENIAAGLKGLAAKQAIGGRKPSAQSPAAIKAKVGEMIAVSYTHLATAFATSVSKPSGAFKPVPTAVPPRASS